MGWRGEGFTWSARCTPPKRRRTALRLRDGAGAGEDSWVALIRFAIDSIRLRKSFKRSYLFDLMLLDSLRRRKILLDARHIFPNPLPSPGRDCLTAAPPNIR